MPKNQNKPKAKKYRRDLNHAESLDNIEFFSIILKIQIILVYDPPAIVGGIFMPSEVRKQSPYFWTMFVRKSEQAKR